MALHKCIDFAQRYQSGAGESWKWHNTDSGCNTEATNVTPISQPEAGQYADVLIVDFIALLGLEQAA